MVRCQIKGCKYTKSQRCRPEDGTTFHHFPPDPVRRELWCQLIRLHCDASFEPIMQPRLCSAHFQDDDFKYTPRGVRYLNKTAIPQLCKEPYKSTEVESLRDGWIPSEETEKILIKAQTSPAGSFFPECDVLSMPDSVLEEELHYPPSPVAETTVVETPVVETPVVETDVESHIVNKHVDFSVSNRHKNICRACRSDSATSDIFNRGRVLAHLYTECTNLKAEPGDGLSRYICAVCRTTLIFFSKFRKNCINSYNALKKHQEEGSRQLGHTSCSDGTSNHNEYSLPTIKGDITEDGEYSEHEYSESEGSPDDFIKVEKGTSNLEYSKKYDVQIVTSTEKSKPDKIVKYRQNYQKTFPAHSELENRKKMGNCLLMMNTVMKNRKTLHQRKNTAPDKDICHICGKTVVPSNYKNHVLSCTNEKQIECTVCSKKFNSNARLSVHMIRHKEKTHICEYCKKGFRAKSELKHHIKTHIGWRISCNMCSKSFTNHSMLAIHRRIHTGVRPYRCDVCEQGFICKNSLTRHKTTHTSERPHQCQFCGKKYKDRNSLRRHRKEQCKMKLSV